MINKELKKLHLVSSGTKIFNQLMMFLLVGVMPILFPQYIDIKNREIVFIVVGTALVTSVMYEILLKILQKEKKDTTLVVNAQLLTSVFLLTLFLFFFDHINGSFFVLYLLTIMESYLNKNLFFSTVIVLIMILATSTEFVWLILQGGIILGFIPIVEFIVRILSLIFMRSYGLSLAESLMSEEKAKNEAQEVSQQLKDANVKIGLADKVKNDLLTMASHEFRTPTTIINNALYFLNTNIVREKLSDREKQNLERIVSTMDRLNYVVTNINQMLVTTSGELELEVTPTQVEIIVREVIEDKYIEAKEKQIEIKYNEPEKLLPEIIADKVKLKYVLWELLTNALKYTNKEGQITIGAKEENNKVKITVADNGVGIPREALPDLFQGFKKIDVFHTTQSGMGLGLYVVKQIVELHEGEIQVDSVEDKGTIVIITLPIKPLSEIKPKKKEVAIKTPNEELTSKEFPHHLNVIKCLATFQLILPYLFLRRLG